MDLVNDVDPITLECEEDILPANIIYLTVDGKRKFYNVRSLYEWTMIKPLDPTTKIPLTKQQLNKIRKQFKGNSVYENISDCVKNFAKTNPETVKYSQIL